MLFIAYAAIVGACAMWLLGAWRTVSGMRRVPGLDAAWDVAQATWPRISLIVPARNEAQSIAQAVQSRLDEGYPNLEIILVNDRSTDETGKIADKIARSDVRVQVVHVQDLPPGWLGKLHALHQGVLRASGEWLLFSDADVQFRPGTLRRSMGLCQQRGVDHLVALPALERTSVLLDATIDFFLSALLVAIDVSRIEDPASKAAIGGGMFSLVRRQVFERTQGFPWLQLEVADDIALGQMLKRAGARQCLVNACESIHLAWYRSLWEMAQGLEKNVYGALGRYHPLRFLAGLSVLLLLSVAPLMGCVWGPWPIRVLSGTAVVLGTFSRYRFAQWTRRPTSSAWLAPLGGLVVTWMALRAGVLALWRGGIVWRGTHYPLSLLRKNMRLEL